MQGIMPDFYIGRSCGEYCVYLQSDGAIICAGKGEWGNVREMIKETRAKSHIEVVCLGRVDGQFVQDEEFKDIIGDCNKHFPCIRSDQLAILNRVIETSRENPV